MTLRPFGYEPNGWHRSGTACGSPSLVPFQRAPGNGCVQNYPSCLEANFLIAASFWPTTQELPRPGNSR